MLVLLVQALLALTLAAGQRSIAGPLHVHGDGTEAPHHHHGPAGAAGRHWHDDASTVAAMVVLDGAAQAAQDLTGGAAAGASAALLPVFPLLPAVPRPDRDAWPGTGTAPGWSDAVPAPPETPPRG